MISSYLETGIRPTRTQVADLDKMGPANEFAAAWVIDGDAMAAARALLEPCLPLFEAFQDAGGRALLVGGCVRDLVLNRPVKDLDIEVFGLSDQSVRAVLATFGSVNLVGQSFAVYKFRPRERSAFNEIDISLPRRDRKSGTGHRGFEIESDPHLSFDEASRRRDLSVNAIFYDPLVERFIDPQDGLDDIRRHMLKAVDASTFVEDSLRVLRVAQLAARLEFQVDLETTALCRTIDLSDLPAERIKEELFKLLLAARPSIGMRVLDETRALEQLFPGLAVLKDGGDSEDGLEHTARALDFAAAQFDDALEPEFRLAVMLAVLVHECRGPRAETDFGQASDNPDITPVVKILNKLDVHTQDGYHLREQVIALTEEYDKPILFLQMSRAGGEPGPLDFARIAGRCDVNLLARTTAAHLAGIGASLEPVSYFEKRLADFGFEHGLPAPLLTGKAVLDAGIDTPGPRLGRLLREIYDRQLEGKVCTPDEALQAARAWLSKALI